MAVVWTCSSQSLHAADRGLVVFTWLYLAHVLIGDVEAPVRVSGAPLTTAWATRSSRTRCVTPSRKLGSKRRSKLAAHLFCPEAIQTNESVKRRTNARTVKWHEALRDCARMLQVGCWKHDARLENTALQLMLCDAEKRERLVPLERLVDRRGHRPSPRLMRFAASEWYRTVLSTLLNEWVLHWTLELVKCFAVVRTQSTAGARASRWPMRLPRRSLSHVAANEPGALELKVSLRDRRTSSEAEHTDALSETYITQYYYYRTQWLTTHLHVACRSGFVPRSRLHARIRECAYWSEISPPLVASSLTLVAQLRLEHFRHIPSTSTTLFLFMF